MTTRTRDSFGSLSLMLLIATTILLLFARFAHAEVVTAQVAAVPSDWMAVAIVIAVILGGLGVILGGVSTILHAIAPRTKTTIDDRAEVIVDTLRAEVASLTGLVRGLLGQAVPGTEAAKLPTLSDLRGATDDGGGEIVGIARGGIVPKSLADLQPRNPTVAESVAAGVIKVSPDGTITGVPARNPQAGNAFLGVLIALTLAGVVVAIACTATQARQTTAVGVVAALDCEAAHLDAQALADARLFASAKVQGWISGVAPGDTAALQARIAADLAPINSDLGRCAITGAWAAATAAVTSSMPGVAVSALSAGDPVQLRAAFSVAARLAGWAPVRTGGEVL